MLKSSLVFLQLVVVAISVWGVYGLTEKEEAAVMKMLEPIMMDCMKECGVKPDDKGSKETENCLKKCTLTKLAVFNEDGKYDIDAVRAHISSTAENEEAAKKHQAMLDGCLKGIELDLKNDKDDEKKVNIIYECFDKVRKS